MARRVGPQCGSQRLKKNKLLMGSYICQICGYVWILIKVPLSYIHLLLARLCFSNLKFDPTKFDLARLDS